MLLLCACGRCKSFPSFALKILSLAGSVIAARSCVQTWALNHLACFCEKPGVLYQNQTRAKGHQTAMQPRSKLLSLEFFLSKSRWLCCCHECDSPWPIPVQQFLDHVRMPWIPSDRFSCHVVLCTSICSLSCNGLVSSGISLLQGLHHGLQLAIVEGVLTTALLDR